MTPNLPVLLLAALIPLATGFAWLHPRLFGGERWCRLNGMASRQLTQGIKPLHWLLMLLFGFFLALGVYAFCVHQSAVFSIVSADMTALQTGTARAFLDEYGDRHLSFGHGWMHAAFGLPLAFALPVLGLIALLDRKPTKILLVYLGYWMLTLGLMGGVIGQWGWSAI